MRVKYPQVTVKIVGGDGNAYAVLGAVKREMRRHKLTDEQYEEYEKEATADDYNHLLRVTMTYFNVE